MRAIQLVALAAGLLLAIQVRTGLADDASDDARVFQLLDQSAYHYTKKSDSVWYIDYNGGTLGNYRVVGAAGQGLLVIFVTIAPKAALGDMAEITYKMVRLNDDLDRVKVGIDRDGDAFVRADVSIRALDGVELKAYVDQVAASAEEAYAAIKPYLVAPAG